MNIEYHIVSESTLDSSYCFLKDIADQFPTPLDKKTDLKQLVNKVFRNGYIILAENRGIPVGINMIYANDYTNYCAWITVLGISPSLRRYGIAGELIRRAEEIALNNGMKHMALFVHSENEKAVNAYRKYGFTENSAIPAHEKDYITFYKDLEG